MPVATKEKPFELRSIAEKESKEKAPSKRRSSAKKAIKPRKSQAKKKSNAPKETSNESIKAAATTESMPTSELAGAPRSFKDFNPWNKIIRPAKPVEEYTNKEVGKEGEKLAALYLEYKGYQIITMNWTSRMGEVDIVARQGDTLVLCEVKTRVCLEEKNVFPELKVDAAKQKKYRQLALQYLIEHPEEDSVRFDVIALVITGQQNARLRHLINAFCFDAEG